MPAGGAHFARLETFSNEAIDRAFEDGKRQGFKEGKLEGIKFAAEIADGYNASTDHPYRLGDCILAKLNQPGACKPRKNTERKKFLKKNAKVNRKKA